MKKSQKYFCPCKDTHNFFHLLNYSFIDSKQFFFWEVLLFSGVHFTDLNAKIWFHKGILLQYDFKFSKSNLVQNMYWEIQPSDAYFDKDLCSKATAATSWRWRCDRFLCGSAKNPFKAWISEWTFWLNYNFDHCTVRKG